MDHRDKPLDSDGDCGPDGAIEGDVDERQQPGEEVGVDPLLGVNSSMDMLKVHSY